MDVNGAKCSVMRYPSIPASQQCGLRGDNLLKATLVRLRGTSAFVTETRMLLTALA